MLVRVVSVLVFTIALLAPTGVNAWTEDKSCDGHDGDSVDRRKLAYEDIPKDIPYPKVKKSKNLESPFNITKNLRGRGASTERKLGASEPTIETFKLKMHWEEGYCWQLEAVDRNWCMSCHGGSCGPDEVLWIQECNDALAQRFVWEPVTVPGRTGSTGKLKPYLAQDLCLENVGGEGAYSHFGVHNDRWWYFLLKPCDDTNLETQILEGFDKNDPFEFVSRDETQERPLRCLSQAHDPRAGEIILGEEFHVARFDFTSLWDVRDLNNDFPETPDTGSSSLFCPPWPLMKTDEEEWEIVTSGNTITNWDADTFVEQYDNGRFVVRRGFPDRKEQILFDNELDLSEGDYYTQLRGNGDLLTFRGTPGNPKGDSVWKIDSDYPEGQYFLGVECDLGTVSLYQYVPEDPGDQLWSTNGTSWVPDGTTLPPMGSAFPSSTPTTSPAPTISPAPTSTFPPTVAPTTSAPPPEIVSCGNECCTPDDPCPLCYGDCDEDSDCEGDLVCPPRSNYEAVPGCLGGEENSSSAQFCVKSNVTPTSPPTGSPTPSPTDPPSPITDTPTPSPTVPLTASPSSSPSIGTADSSATPSPTPSPTDPPSPITDTPTPFPTVPLTASPSSSPSIGTAGSSATPAPTSAPNSGPGPEVMAQGGSYCTPTAPCKLCEGDCDNDSDCEGPLICEQRESYQVVSSCSGGEKSMSSTDYCVHSIEVGGSSPSTTSPPAPSTVPITDGTLPALSYSDSCLPTSPCEKCVGDCDDDSDCAGSLVCPDRHGGEPVPGCSGTDGSKTDFCVDP